MKRFASIILLVALIVLHVGVADAQNKRAIAPQTGADKEEAAVTPNESGTTRQSADPRELAEAYIAAVLAGNTRAASAFATGTVTTNKRLTSKEWMDEFRELLDAHSLDIETVRVKDMAGSALAVSRRIKLTKPLRDVGDTVRLVIQMSADGGGWVIKDVDLWSEPVAEKALARFNQQQSDAREIPAVRDSSTAAPKVDALKHAKVRDEVEKAFEARQQQQRAELAKLQQRFGRIQDLIESRERIKDQIIDRRVEELLNPDLKWEPTETLNRIDGIDGRVRSKSTGEEWPAEVAKAGRMPGGPSASKSQVLFSTPHRMNVVHRTHGDERPLVCPVRLEMAQGVTHEIHLSNIPEYAGLDFYPTLEIRKATKQTELFLKHNAITVAFTKDDFDNTLAGNLVTRVMFLPDHEAQAIVGVESLTSTKLDPNIDPIAEAERLGSIVAILQIGNRSHDK